MAIADSEIQALHIKSQMGNIFLRSIKMASDTLLIDSLWSRPTTLLYYPPTIDSNIVIRLILGSREIEGKTVQLMVRNQDQINRHFTAPLNPRFFLPYGDSAQLRKTVQVNSLIIIDRLNPPRIRQLISILKQPRKAHLLYLNTRDNGITSLRNLTLTTPTDQRDQISRLILSVSDSGPVLSLLKNRTNMLPRQRLAYYRRREIELKNGKKTDDYTPARSDQFIMINYVHSSMVGNFIYPDRYQKILEEESSQKRLTGRRVKSRVPPDVDESNNGWLTRQIVIEMKRFSPKFLNLFTIIQLYLEERALIYTNYVNRSGLVLLSTLLDYLDRPHISLSGSDSIDQRMAKIKDFNTLPKYSTGVIMTSIIPPSPIKNVSHFHLIERYNQEDYLALRQSIYRFDNYTKPIGTLTVHFHLSELADGALEKSSDAMFYDRLMDKIKNWNQSLAKLLDPASDTRVVGANNLGQLVIIKPPNLNMVLTVPIPVEETTEIPTEGGLVRVIPEVTPVGETIPTLRQIETLPALPEQPGIILPIGDI